MTDEPENIVPVMLRWLDTKFDGLRDELVSYRRMGVPQLRGQRS